MTVSVLASTLAVDRGSLLFGVLAVVADVLAVAVLVLAVAGLGARDRPAIQRGRGLVARVGPWVAAAVAVVATSGSLWFSEVAGLAPCRLCWFQRIAMYPLALLLVVAAARRDRSVAWYAVPLAAIGAVISTYHYVLEWRPSLDRGGCDPLAPCTVVYFRRFGFASLPFMALSGFLAIVALTLAANRWRDRPDRGAGWGPTADRGSP
ncbi:MAG: disulfide bond formation protein [Acidimicrobiales bacterium]|nr:disulfide bond formation protein [Acidimicrobiales bacterium]